jgi:phosphatidylinositol alpha-1,6-mannosyltransferase
MTGTTLLLAENFPPKTGGASRWFWELYRRMPQDRVVILTGEDRQPEPFDRKHDMAVMRMRLAMPEWGIASLRGLADYARNFRHLWRAVRCEGVEMIHCGRLLPEGWLVWLLRKSKGTPYLCYVHGEDLNLGLLSREFGWMMRRILRDAQLLVANSHNTTRLLTNVWNIPSERIALLHPGVDVARFVPADCSAEVRWRLGWHGRPIVLTVGRLQKRKGHDRLIHAMKRIRESIPDVLYAIVGEGEERPRLEALIGQLGLEGHVRLYGQLGDDDLLQCYQQCDLFALPNREVDGDIEGFGMVLLEAQACGKPVIAGTSGGTAETMCEGETGRLVPCDGPEDLAAVVTGLLLDDAQRERMGRAARRWTVEHFSWQSLVRQAQTLFPALGDGASGSPIVPHVKNRQRESASRAW